MKAKEFLRELKLENKALSIIPTDDKTVSSLCDGANCSLNFLTRALNGETVYITEQNLSCRGAVRGFGFSDECPKVKGGFEFFISYGAGVGFPEGERVKNNPETVKEMIELFIIPPCAP